MSLISVGINIVAKLTEVSGEDVKDDIATAKGDTLPTTLGTPGSVAFAAGPSTARFFTDSAMGI